MRKILAAAAIVAATLLPVGTATAHAAPAQSPLYCKTNTRFWFIFCFQINGPNNSDFVYSFSGSIHEVNDVAVTGVLQIEGPSGTWAQWAYDGPYQYDPWWVSLARPGTSGSYLYPGTYCAGFLGTWVCQGVHP